MVKRRILDKPPLPGNEGRRERTFEDDGGVPDERLEPGRRHPDGTRLNPEIPYETAENASWHRQEDESVIWYRRFLIYLSLPANKRSILEAYRRYLTFRRKKSNSKQAAGGWYKEAKKRQWHQRAADMEAYDVEFERFEIEKMKTRLRKARLMSLTHMHTKLIKSLPNFDIPTPDPENPDQFKDIGTFSKVADILIKLNAAIMAESGDVPAQKMEFSWDNNNGQVRGFDKDAFLSIFGADDSVELLQRYAADSLSEEDEEENKDEK